MVKFYNNLSPATKLLIQSFLAVLGSVLAAVIVATYQSFSASGTLDLQTLLNVSLATFALLFGKAMHDWVPAHAQQLITAGKDNEAALYDALQRAQTISSSMIASVDSKSATQASQSQIQPQVIVQASTGLKNEDIQAISAQLAVNLANMAGTTSTPAPIIRTSAHPNQIDEPTPDPYYDPLKQMSAVLPVYVPQVPFPS
jgi:hypothetical protein